MRVTTIEIEEMKMRLRAQVEVSPVLSHPRVVKIHVPESVRGTLCELAKLLSQQYETSEIEAVGDILQWLTGNRKVDLQDWLDNGNCLPLPAIQIQIEPDIQENALIQVWDNHGQILLKQVLNEKQVLRFKRILNMSFSTLSPEIVILELVREYLLTYQFLNWLIAGYATALPGEFAWEQLMDRANSLLVVYTALPEWPVETEKIPDVEPMVKTGLLLETLKFDILNCESNLFQEQLQQEALGKDIQHMGLDLNLVHERAIFAIQKLISQSEYLDVLEQLNPESDEQLQIPVLKVTPSQYLHAFGVGRRKTSRGRMEFNANERKEALQALLSLSQREHLMVYQFDRQVVGISGEKEIHVQRLETIAPLIVLKSGKEALMGKKGTRLRMIGIQPAAVFFEPTGDWYILKPAHYYQEIRAQFGKTSRFVYRFIDFLVVHTAWNQLRKESQIDLHYSFKELATKLRMNALITSRNWKYIQQVLTKCCDIAQALGYLDAFELQGEGIHAQLGLKRLMPMVAHLGSISHQNSEGVLMTAS